MTTNEERICGTCKHHKHRIETHDVTGYQMCRWECDNSKSDNYTFMTDYEDTCDMWAEKE